MGCGRAVGLSQPAAFSCKARGNRGCETKSVRLRLCRVFLLPEYMCISDTTGHMSTKSTPECLLRQIAQIHRMDHGTVSVIRQGPHGPYYNHQCYENGRNVSRYVPAEQVPELEQAIEGYRRFQELVKQYVQLRVEQTRAERQAGSKKRVLRCFQWNRGVDRRAKAPEERHVYSQSAGTFPAKLRTSGIELPPPASALESPTDPMPLLRSLAPSVNVGATNMALLRSFPPAATIPSRTAKNPFWPGMGCREA